MAVRDEKAALNAAGLPQLDSHSFLLATDQSPQHRQGKLLLVIGQPPSNIVENRSYRDHDVHDVPYVKMRSPSSFVRSPNSCSEPFISGEITAPCLRGCCAFNPHI
jgi:hypothetical protein